MFGASKRPVVGLDIGSNSVKMVSVRANGGIHVSAAAMHSIDTRDPKGVVKAIRQCLRGSGRGISRGSNFVFGLSGSGVKVSSFTFKHITLEEITQAVMFEAAQVCPFDIRSSVVDYQLIAIDGKNADEVNLRKKKKTVHDCVTGVLAVATNELVSQNRKFADDAALKCRLMDSEALALLNCVRENIAAENQLPIAVVNVGNSVTTVAILGTDGLPFIRDLGHSGKDITQSLAKSKDVTIESMAYEVSRGEASSCSADEISQACGRLTKDVSETLAFYANRHDGSSVNKVYLCGGFGLLGDFARTLSGSIVNEVCIWNPLSDMAVDEGAVDTDTVNSHGPAFAVAAGLAMRQV